MSNDYKMNKLYVLGLLFLINSLIATGQNSSEWDKWIKANSYGLLLSDTGNYQDLAFLKETLKDKRIVFLGENSHGVSEFTTLKSRMIRFLHDSLGFEVLAFESNLGDAYYANSQITSSDNKTSIYNSLSSLWHVEEIVPLFNYIRSTHQTPNPLILSGVDFQASNGSYTFSRFLHDLINPIDPSYAKNIRETDSTVTRAIVRAWTMFSQLSKEEIASNLKKIPEWLSFYANLQDYLEKNENEFQLKQSQNLKLASYCIQDRIDCIHHGIRDSAYMANKLSECCNVQQMTVGKLWDKYRDYKMEEHLNFLYSELYKGKKIIVWAQDSHIYKRKCHLAGDSAYAKDVYTIAFRSYTGKGCYVLSIKGTNSKPTRPVYKFKTPTDSLSIERIMHTAGHKISFVDMLHQNKRIGNSWMFEKSKWTQWAGTVVDEETNIRELFDGFILVDKISPPHYLKIDYEYLK
jgi:erythromycin esterase